MNRTWFDVRDRLPEASSTRYSVSVIGFNSVTGCVNQVSLYLPDPTPYTHWMPMPEPPSPQEQEDARTLAVVMDSLIAQNAPDFVSAYKIMEAIIEARDASPSKEEKQ